MRVGLPTDESFSVNPWVTSAERRCLDIVVAALALLIFLAAAWPDPACDLSDISSSAMEIR
jgi:hypothetical protein